MRVGYLMDVGLQRDVNQDSVYVDENLGLFIVADGIGGYKAGEVASQLATEIVSKGVTEGLRSGREISEVIKDAVYQANRRIFHQGQSDERYKGMGTTLALALYREPEIILAHLGDSRIYQIRAGQIRQLTHDHSQVNEMVRNGLLEREEAHNHPLRHIITRALGMAEDIEPEINVQPWDQENRLLLCSDGLTDMVTDEEILEIVQNSTDPQEGCRRLVAAANEYGGRDNIAVILVC